MKFLPFQIVISCLKQGVPDNMYILPTYEANVVIIYLFFVFLKKQGVPWYLQHPQFLQLFSGNIKGFDEESLEISRVSKKIGHTDSTSGYSHFHPIFSRGYINFPLSQRQTRKQCHSFKIIFIGKQVRSSPSNKVQILMGNWKQYFKQCFLWTATSFQLTNCTWPCTAQIQRASWHGEKLEIIQ